MPLDQGRRDAEARRARAGPGESSIRALLVEDVPDSASATLRKLASSRQVSFDVEHRRTLRAAMSRVQLGSIDVVLLDPDLPDSSGVDSVVRLHEAAPCVPIVVVTDDEDEHLALRCLRARAEDHVVRSRTSKSVLQRTIRRALERRRIRAGQPGDAPVPAESDARFRSLVSACVDGLAVVSRDGRLLFANASAQRLVGRPAGELDGAALGQPFAAGARREIASAGGGAVEVHVAAGEWDGEGVWVVSLFDVTVHKRSQADLREVSARMHLLNARLERLASIDPLTELLNRRGLEAELSIEVRRMRRTAEPLAAVLIDCDDFKRVNECHGHACGDVVLKELADRLKQSLRPSDHIGRIGGDEFLVLLPDTRFAEACQVAERLRLSVSDNPLSQASGFVHVTASLGIESVSDQSPSIDALLVRTEASLRHSKRNGKNRVSTRDGDATSRTADAEAQVQSLRLETAFRVIRRPIVRLLDEAVSGWEFLPRAQGVFELPRDFFRLALEHDILTQVDRHCLHSCMREACALPAGPVFHFNVFPSTLLETPLERVAGLFSSPIPASRICVEISEQHFVGEPYLLRDRVLALQDAGILVAIDDVGFGRGSLETLILLEPDMVKLDPKYIHRCATDTGRERPLRRLAGVVASLGCKLAADGISSREELALLREIGVHYGQGPLWGPAD